jgi:type IV pilus assembly protein PilC
MAVYIYKARTATGQLVDGTLEAENERVLNSKLAAMGYIPVSIQLQKKQVPIQEFFLRFQKVKLKSLVVFTRQFSTMISAGLSLVKCLDILAQQTEDLKLREIVKTIRQSVEDGSTLANAFAQHPQVFSNLFINLVHAGEVGGVLDEVMQRLSIFLEKDQALKTKIKSAMTYPTVVLGFAVLIVFGLVTFVLPTFISMFEGMELELPLPTKILLKVSNFLRNPMGGGITIVSIVAGIILLMRYISTPIGKRQYDRFLLKMPVFGQLNVKSSISRFARTLATLLSSGVPVMQALEVTAKSSGNTVIEEAVMTARASIREGESIAGPLAESKIFPPMVTQMIAVGEETGNLDGMLQKISDFYDMEVENTLASLTSLLEPLLMIGIGGVVGFIVISMFLPMFKLIGGITSK